MDTRIHIIPKDLTVAYGYSEGHARRVLNQVKQDLEMKDSAILTIKQYCEHVEIDLIWFLDQIKVSLPNMPPTK